MDQVMKQNINNTGFTLIELLIAVVIITLLASIAIPSYQSSVTRTKRGEAMAAMTSASQALERFKSANNFSYAGAAFGAGGIFTNQVPVDGGTAYYNLTLATTASTYTITATAVGAQLGDGNLTVNSAGARTWNGNNCWPTSSTTCP
jgi:type IV pilus assembly protein PilE